VKIKAAQLPTGVSLSHIWGAGMLGGIGFTMAIFVSNLAFTDTGQVELSKVAVLCGSVVAAVAGYVFLRVAGKE
jgi:NhaA family Na+:H+ antiporter